MKFIFWAIVILVALLVVRLIAARPPARNRDGDAAPGRAGAPGRRTAASQPAAVGASEPMVRCAHCGIHLPRSEALLQGGQTWCSSEHASLGARQ